MQGAYRVQITTKRLRYDFTLREKFTLIQGDSGTGKTCLYDLIVLSCKEPWVKVDCPAECIPLHPAVENWGHTLQEEHNCIFFLDQDSTFMEEEAFAEAAMASDNYFVLITQAHLPHIPYGWTGITEMQTINGVHTLKQRNPADSEAFLPTCVLVEENIDRHPLAQKTLDGIQRCPIETVWKQDLCRVLRSAGMQKESVLVLADGSVIGSTLDHLLGIRDYTHQRIQLRLLDGLR